MNYIKITKTDIANGTGVRVVLWVAGCDVHCKGCHNPQSWDFNAGQPFTDETMLELLDALNKPYIKGLTLSGGHPLAPQNVPTILEIIKTVKKECPRKDIWLYTGYKLDDYYFWGSTRDANCNKTPLWLQLKAIQSCDVIVDGAYVEDLRDISLKFRGSSNQRIIDVKRTIASGEICRYNTEVKC